MTPRLGPPVQIAYVVPDAEVAARQWAESGAGPFYLRRHIPLAETTYRGRVSSFDHTSAYGQWGSLMIELVQDHGTGPSVVRERFAPDEMGLHHLAFFVDDLDLATEELAAQGHEVAMTARTSSGLRFHFIDAVRTRGHYVELYERNEHLAAFYGRVAAAAFGWDGTDPVREV